MVLQTVMNGTAMNKIVYSPALRLKEGEYKALSLLAPSIMERITPLFIIPPPKEGDVETSHEWATADEAAYVAGDRIGHYWPYRPSYIDARFLFDAFPHEDAAVWLPNLFKVARNFNGMPIPITTLDDMVGPNTAAFQSSVSTSGFSVKLGIRIQYSEIGDQLQSRVADALKTFGLTSNGCTVFLDFADADMSNVDDVATFLLVAIEDLISVGVWQNIVFQGTNYPKKNPAIPGGSFSVPRNEWLAWCAAVKTDPEIVKYCVFGDYAADCAPEFAAGGGGRAIIHYRYATPESWEVYRASDGVTHRNGIRSVCTLIVNSEHFSGPNFSEADRYIQSTAQGYEQGGSATTWREMNTVRHITMVLSQLGEQQGFKIEKPVWADEQQGELF